MKEKDIRDAYCKIRSIDNTISDEVLDFMKDAAIRGSGLPVDFRQTFISGANFGASWKEKQMFTREDMENLFIHTIAQRAIDNTPRLKGMRVWFDEFMKAYYPEKK